MTVPHAQQDFRPSQRAPGPDNKEVARRAYAKWASRNPASGCELQDWLEAETEFALETAMIEQLTEAKERLVNLFAQRRDAERRLVAEHSVSSILALAETLADAAPKLAQAICECLDWDVGAVWLVDRDANVLRSVAVWSRPDINADSFERETQLRTFSPGIGMPGRVWANKSVVWIADVTAEINFPRVQVAAEAGLHRAIGFPVWNGLELLGVLEFFSREALPPDEQLQETMTCIGNQISQFIERRGAESRLYIQQHERRIAREIQQGLLPNSMPRLPGFQISGRSLAPNVVGGDCFDFIPLPGAGPDSIGVLVADASGHGIAAALLSVQIRAYLRGLALTCTDVGLLLDLANQCLSQAIVSDHYVTAFLLKLDPSNRSLNYSSAGHLPGYVLDARGQTRAVLPSTGFPLGIDPANTFPASSTLFLEPGELVFLFTDGIVETVAPDGKPFGIERALGLVRNRQQQLPDEILTELFDAVRDFCHNKCLDDLTAVIIKSVDAA